MKKNSTDTEVAVAGRDIVGEHKQETVDSPTRDRVMSSILHNGPSTPANWPIVLV
ncbi:iron-sulfur cluster regulator SufR [Cutibacterium acnes JCM 18918]|nr:iron-sulfur cluster regulator SufR [Cutibacterium acnes JCM 18918]